LAEQETQPEGPTGCSVNDTTPGAPSLPEPVSRPAIPNGTIRTPLAQQWKRVRHQLVPLLTMSLALAATVYLWNRHNSPMDGVGVVRVVEASATSPADGSLIEPPGGPLTLHAKVTRGSVIARLDDRNLLNQLKVLQLQLTQLERELPAKAEMLRIEQAARRDIQLDQARQLNIEVERYQLSILQQQAQLEADQVEYQQQQTLCDMLRKHLDKGAAGETELAAAKLRRDVVDQRIKGTQRSIDATKQLLDKAKENLGTHADPAKADVDRILEPVRAAIETQRARLDELQVQLQALDIHAPIDGRITKISRQPGQSVKSGEPIVTITKDRSHQVLTYVRPEQHVAPFEGMGVQIRARNGRRAASAIGSVGPAFEQIPPHHLRDPKLVEWGIPVLIDVPNGLQLQPGEPVDIRFIPGSGT
jgi:multidrug resistance efflux pump